MSFFILLIILFAYYIFWHPQKNLILYLIAIVLSVAHENIKKR